MTDGEHKMGCVSLAIGWKTCIEKNIEKLEAQRDLLINHIAEHCTESCVHKCFPCPAACTEAKDGKCAERILKWLEEQTDDRTPDADEKEL